MLNLLAVWRCLPWVPLLFWACHWVSRSPLDCCNILALILWFWSSRKVKVGFGGQECNALVLKNSELLVDFPLYIVRRLFASLPIWHIFNLLEMVCATVGYPKFDQNSETRARQWDFPHQLVTLSSTADWWDFGPRRVEIDWIDLRREYWVHQIE